VSPLLLNTKSATNSFDALVTVKLGAALVAFATFPFENTVVVLPFVTVIDAARVNPPVVEQVTTTVCAPAGGLASPQAPVSNPPVT
jgi:hypothetical protein